MVPCGSTPDILFFIFRRDIMEPKEQIKAIEEKALADLNNVKDLEGLTNF